ncbi:MAG: hypothetical protein VCC00_15190 [Deltaproteobacteria bacterium]
MITQPTYTLAGLFLCAAMLLAGGAQASCDLFPGVERTYDGALGSANRPWAAPGESLELRHRSCDAQGAVPAPLGSANVVTIAYLEPGATGASLVVLTDSCDAAFAAEVASCTASKGVAAALCAETDSLMNAGASSLRFAFPDAVALFGGAGLAGATRIAVTRRGDAVPCDLARRSCDEIAGVDICVGALFADAGACDTGTPASLFTHFTALPRPNEFSAACFRDEGLCAATENELRFVADQGGNLFLPVDWSGVLAEQDDFPIPRLVRATIDSPIPFRIPDEVFVASFTSDGGRLPPIFTPLFEPSATGDPDKVVFFGSADAPYTILRFAHRHGTCQGGTEDGELCEDESTCSGSGAVCELACVDNAAELCRRDSDCLTGACGALFDASLFLQATAPFALPRPGPGVCQLPPHDACTLDADCPASGDACVFWALEAGDAVPLDGILETDELWAFTFDESIDATDRNGDGDTEDTVVTIRSRATAAVTELDLPAACGVGQAEGRTTMRLLIGDFDFPAVAAEGERIAFLEPETDFASGCDIDSDGTPAGIALSTTALADAGRVFSAGASVDPALQVDGGAFALSGGYAFARFGAIGGGAATIGVLEGNGAFATFCRADAVATADGVAAFLRPESAVAGNVACPAGPLNGDGDASDTVVHLLARASHDGSWTVQNLGLAATAVDLSRGWVAALVPESGEPGSGNGDGDSDDSVVYLRERSAGASWQNVGLAADRLLLVGDVVAFRVPEADQAGTDLNQDGDALDRVLHAMVAGRPPANALAPAVDFVLGTEAVMCAGSDRIVQPLAFTTKADMNDDGLADEVELQIFNAATDANGFLETMVVRTGAAVHACDSYACDPREPFHVQGHEIRFLTNEADQGVDLDGDGTADDIVLQIFDSCASRTRTVGAFDEELLGARNPLAARPSIVSGEVLVQQAGRCVEPWPVCSFGQECRCPKGTLPAAGVVAGSPVCVHVAPASCDEAADCGKAASGLVTCEMRRVAIAVQTADDDGDGIIDSRDDCDADGLVGECVDGLLCRKAKERKRQSGIDELRVVDALGTHMVTPRSVEVACRATGLSGAAVNEADRLVSRWRIHTESFTKIGGVRAKDRFGLHELVIRRPSSLLLPANEGAEAPGVLNRGYQCYDVREARPQVKSRKLTLAGSGESAATRARYTLSRLKRLCLVAGVGPAATVPDGTSWLCYRAKPQVRRAARPWTDGATGMTDLLGEHIVKLGSEREVCVRAKISLASLGAGRSLLTSRPDWR